MAEASVKERVNHTVYYIKEIWSPETGTDSVFFGLFFFDFTLIIIITSCPNGDFAVTAQLQLHYQLYFPQDVPCLNYSLSSSL